LPVRKHLSGAPFRLVNPLLVDLPLTICRSNGSHIYKNADMTISENFPKNFDFQAAQPRIYKMWEERGCFHSEPDPDKKPFTIVIPPPNVTGALHLGHALNCTLQDTLVRMKRMQGFNALWMPGTDHAGIATQAVVERRLREEEGKSRHDLGRTALVERIWAWKEQYEKRIIGQLKQMGSSCDWQRLRFTLDEQCALAVRRTFFDLFQKEYIFRGKRLVNWDSYLGTAVSNDEVYHEKKQGHFWHILYPVIDPQPGEPTHVEIATTRPETMLGDTAVAVHPDPDKAFDKVEAALREKIAAAAGNEKEPLTAELEALLQRRTEMLPKLQQLRDMAADGRMLQLPLTGREIPLVADIWAKPEMGSGCVKITPAHDPNDYEVGRRCDLPKLNIMNPDGTLNINGGEYRGQTMAEARKSVVAALEAAGLLGEVEDREIELAHSDRSKTAIEPYLADQWFVKMADLSQSAIDAVEDKRVKIFPQSYTRTYVDWLSEKRDWPVSRQLWWGHRIPIWSQDCQNQAEIDGLLQQLQSDDDIAQQKAAYSVELNEDRQDETERFAAVHICIADEDNQLAAKYEQQGYVREEDVLDTWFSSALWPHSTLGWPGQTKELDYYYPTSTLITSRDIISLWVARMVLMGLNNMGEVPFREVFIHPKILDGYGETMSKSKGNGVDPLDVIEKFGADALRFGLAHLTTETQDLRMPVKFECPHCNQTMDQTKDNRELPQVKCTNKKCGKPFSTQWAHADEDKALPRGPAVSERFELGRNFCNKLWNATRFVMMNLEGFEPGPVAGQDLLMEDRWILSRLATVTQQTTAALESFHYAEAARTLYDFAWDEFCSFYLEMLKNRLADDAPADTKTAAQRVLAHTLDNLLRLLHPVIPFITEEMWAQFATLAPVRTLDGQPAAELIMQASWPVANQADINEEIEGQFPLFQKILGALREIRAQHKIPNREPVEFYVRCDDTTTALMQPMAPYFASMTNATAVAWGQQVQPPSPNATQSLPGIDIYIDLKNFIDVEAEKAKLEKEIGKISGFITGKKKKLENAGFVDRAPAEVVQRERDHLEQMIQQLATLQESLAQLQNL